MGIDGGAVVPVNFAANFMNEKSHTLHAFVHILAIYN